MCDLCVIPLYYDKQIVIVSVLIESLSISGLVRIPLFCSLQGVRTPILQLSAMQEGDYTFQLTVTDSSGQQDTAQVTVIVQPGIYKTMCFMSCECLCETAVEHLPNFSSRE